MVIIQFTNIPNSALSSIDNAKLTNSTITITGDGGQTSAYRFR